MLLVSGEQKPGTWWHIGAFTCIWNVNMTTGATYQRINRSFFFVCVFFFILLWTSCPILAKRYLFNSRKYLWTCIIEPLFLFLLLISPLLQWSCFVWVFHFALVTRHGVMWASWSTRLFFFPDPNQIYCSVLHSESGLFPVLWKMYCRTRSCVFFFLWNLYRGGGDPDPRWKICTSDQGWPNLFIKATTTCKGRSWGTRFIHEHLFSIFCRYLGQLVLL